MSNRHTAHWLHCTLEDIAQVVQGQSPPGDSYNDRGEGLPFFQGKAEFGPIYPVVRKWCTDAKKEAATGDILISIRAPVGPTNICSVRCAIGRGLAALRPLGGIPSRYLLYFMRHSSPELASRATGTTFKAISGRQLRAHAVSVPPLPEQHRIVEAIESYLSRLDAAMAALERVKKNVERYRASVLKAAVEGRLVPTEAELARKEGCDYEPASVLLERILKERRKRWEEAQLEKYRAKGKEPPKNWRSKYKEPAPPDTSKLPELPEGWCWTTSEMFFWDGSYGTSQKCTYNAAGPPVLRIPNVKDRTISLDDVKYATGIEKLSREGILEPGDFVFIRTNGSLNLIGRGALIVEELPDDYYFASYLIRLKLVVLADVHRWFALLWQSGAVREQLLEDAASSAGQHNVSLAAATRYTVPLAPSAEESRILAELERAESLATAVMRQVTSSIQRCYRLRQSILKWAFEGKLVDQDPNDEPASVLLGRIKAEREAMQPTKKARRPRARNKKRSRA